ncbi:MAG TPA: hypothetical protein DDY70_01325 [Clostridiales bacterium]|nr:hypothetical protein [Clostridiales bacterium]
MGKCKEWFEKVKAACVRAWQATKTFFVNLWHKIAGFFSRAIPAIGRFFRDLPKNVVNFFKRAIPATGRFFRDLPHNTVTFFKEFKWPDKKGWARIWDKTTTGILILLFASPLLILAYILIWFMVK